MNKIATKRQLQDFVGDSTSTDHPNYAEIRKILANVRDLHGRSAAVRQAVKDAQKLFASKTAVGASAAEGTKKAKKTAPAAAKTPRSAPCICGCGGVPAGKKTLFCQGHDARLKGMVQRFAAGKEGATLTPDAHQFAISWDSLPADLRQNLAEMAVQ